MEIQILVEPVAENRYRATNGALSLSAEGQTPEQAAENLKQLLAQRIAAGARVMTVTVGAPGHRLLAQAGMYKDDPLFDEWQQAIRDYRNERENDPDVA